MTLDKLGSSRVMINDQQLNESENDLKLTRFVLSSLVIWSHCFGLINGGIDVDEFRPILGHSIAHFAVRGFFFLSGFLVYASLIRRLSITDFMIARLVRIWPGLFVCVSLTVFVGFLASQLTFNMYMQGDTIDYLVFNLSLTRGWYYLSGINCGLIPCNINGSLWTLTWEVRCYIILCLIFITGVTQRNSFNKVALPIMLFIPLLVYSFVSSNIVGDVLTTGSHFSVFTFCDLIFAFLLGIYAYTSRRSLYLSWRLCLILLGVLGFSNAITQSTIFIDSVFMGYVVLCLGFRSPPRLKFFRKFPDCSFGIYIYAFPIMIVAQHYLATKSHSLLALVNLVLVIPVATASWYFVEKPSISKFRLRAR